MTDLAVIASEPHGAGSEAQRRVREYIVSRVGTAGQAAEIQSSAQISNILVRIPGTESTGTVLVTGHYDSHPPAPGAGDDGISVAAMLETIRVLRALPQLQNDVLFLFTDGEESGWRGALAFIRKYPEARQDSVLLVFDALPGNAPLLLQETSPGDAWLVRQMLGVPIAAWASSSKRDQERNEQDTDFDSFAPAGFTGMVFENEANGTRYHTDRDITEAISPDRVQAYGKTMLALIDRFGTMDLGTRSPGPDMAYATLPLAGIVAYPGWLMPALTGLAFLSLIAFAIVGWQRKQFSFGRFLLSMLGLLIGIMLVVLLVQMIWLVILKKFAAGAAAGSGFESSAGWLSVLMAVAASLMILLLPLLNRRLGEVNLTIAAPVVFLMLGFAFYLLDAGANPLTTGWFTWSFFGSATGTGILLFTKRPIWKVFLLLCSAFLMLAMAGPWIVLGIYTREDAWLPVLVVSVWVCLFAPQVNTILGDNIDQDTFITSEGRNKISARAPANA